MLPFVLFLLFSPGPPRNIESVIPALGAGPDCDTRVEVRNLGKRTVFATLEAYTREGALLPYNGQSTVEFQFAPGSLQTFTLPSLGENDTPWAKLREIVPAPGLFPVLSVSAVAECLAAGQLRSSARQVSHPARDAWFNGDVAELPGAFIMVVNSSERPAIVSGCYSAGILISNPDSGNSQLVPLCSLEFRDQLPPFAARQFAVQREGSTHFALITQGNAIVLQMLRPIAPGVKLFQVDSSISFGAKEQ